MGLPGNSDPLRGRRGMSTYVAGRRWAIARRSDGCDPDRYLGELRHLPTAERRQPGEWCDLVVSGEQTTKWTLVILDDGVALSTARSY